VKEHDLANEILDLQDREAQVNKFKTVPKQYKDAVGEMVKIAKLAGRNGCLPGWRANWIDHKK
jgi:hypothetical protein